MRLGFTTALLAALLLACGIVLSPCACAYAADIPAVTDAELEQALTLAGSNRGELESVLFRYERDGFATAALRFQIVNMPLADLGCVTAEQIAENYELAFAVLELPYTQHYDLATWAHYVLPMRVSQEPLEDWRRLFHDELRPGVEDVDTLELAYTKIRPVADRCGFKQTQRRDQGPFSTLKSGYGRCEELIIVHVDALRAIGVPARLAYCPYWSHTDNNHAWVELMLDDGKWYCDEVVGDPTRKGGWVMAGCRNASVVVSTCYGLPAERGEDVLNWKEAVGARFCTVNSIGNYRETGRIAFDVPEARRPGAYEYFESDDPAELGASVQRSIAGGAADSIGAGAEWNAHVVTVHVFNFGALRQVARIPLDDMGRAEIELGPGAYIISTSAAVDNPEVWAEVAAGDTLQLAWDDAEPPAAEYMVVYPNDQ